VCGYGGFCASHNGLPAEGKGTGLGKPYGGFDLIAPVTVP